MSEEPKIGVVPPCEQKLTPQLVMQEFSKAAKEYGFDNSCIEIQPRAEEGEYFIKMTLSDPTEPGRYFWQSCNGRMCNVSDVRRAAGSLIRHMRHDNIIMH